ncbi:MAG TPA: CoA pyrophosphatase [Candidatus Binataceae bacterium]|jgi:8-oxo-dGTP pyrophosphatase MutT (NUDIX family)|nr:CoA pyrophosphatase [Candidatus Binataceae bacterium]
MPYEEIETLRRRLAPLHGPDGAAGTRGKVRAAVLVPIFDRDGELYMLFIRRSATVATHQGQVAFPGGRSEPEDPDILTTALREAQEEVGLRPETVEVLGRLTTAATMTSNYLVTPFVGVIGVPTDLRADEHEVAEIFSVPFAALRDPRFRGHYKWNRGGSIQDYPAIFYGEQPIWGLTLRITEELLALL